MQGLRPPVAASLLSILYGMQKAPETVEKDGKGYANADKSDPQTARPSKGGEILKVNLKNRPKVKQVNQVGMEVEEWFESFEKELRKRFEEALEEDYAKYGETRPFERIVKEILGES